jgi:hypothetical protein
MPNTDTTQRMIEALTKRLEIMFEVPITEMKLYPARGYWRQTKADVQQFTGSVLVNGFFRSIGCWESMSDCLRYGFEVHNMKGEFRADADIVCEAKGRRYVRA